MKKIIVLLFALCMIIALAACGDMRVYEPMNTTVPYVTANPDDGFVTDRDGIISEDDTMNNQHKTSGDISGRSGRRIGTIDTGISSSAADK